MLLATDDDKQGDDEMKEAIHFYFQLLSSNLLPSIFRVFSKSSMLISIVIIHVQFKRYY